MQEEFKKMKGWYADKIGHSNAAKKGWKKRKLNGRTSHSVGIREFRESRIAMGGIYKIT